jgi:hypothetical protein
MLTADAVKYFGTKVAIARKLGIYKTSVSKWGRVVPPHSAARLHELTNGQLEYRPSSRRYKRWYSWRPSAAKKNQQRTRSRKRHL